MIRTITAAAVLMLLAFPLRSDAERGTVRVADAARGPRAALLLADEFLPRGDFDIRVSLRAATASAQPHARVWLQTLDGIRGCDVLVSAMLPGGTSFSCPAGWRAIRSLRSRWKLPLSPTWNSTG